MRKRVQLDNEDEDDEDADEDVLNNLKKKDKVAWKNLNEVKTELERTEHNLMYILKLPMRLQDRIKLIQYYELYKEADSAEERLKVRDKFNTALSVAKIEWEHYKAYTKKEIRFMNKTLEDLTDHQDSNKSLLYSILNLNTVLANKQIIYNKYIEMEQTHKDDDEKSKLKKWILWAISLPYDNMKIHNFNGHELSAFLQSVSNKMDKELYGMAAVKEQILMFLNLKLSNPYTTRCNLGLVGPPGVGKTAIAKLLASVMDIPFEQISFGGIKDVSSLK